jgi:hypothetical protein
MFWYIVLGSGVVSLVLAATRGQNPLLWFFTSAAGIPLLGMIPPANGKALGEQKRARRKVGDKVGLVVGGAVVGVLGLLSIIGVI